jgi:hypothetical protein
MPTNLRVMRTHLNNPTATRLRYYSHVVLEPDAAAESGRPRRKRGRPEEEESEEAREEDATHASGTPRKRSKPSSVSSGASRPIPVRYKRPCFQGGTRSLV